MKPDKPQGTYLIATSKAVVLYNNGKYIKITPLLAELLALTLPKYAQKSRNMAGGSK